MAGKSKRIFISAGEISGDHHAAELMKALKKIGDFEFYGLGGSKMIAEGLIPLRGDTSTLNTVGFVESFRFIARKLRLLKHSIDLITQKEIQNVILVDNQGFSLPLGKAAREKGSKVFYYIPPRVSVWGAWNAKKVAAVSDYILPFLASDEPIYRKEKTPIFYAGNPVSDKIAQFEFDPSFYEKFHLDQKQKTVALFPGSRHQEISALLPVLMKSAALLKNSGVKQFLLPVSHEKFLKTIQSAVLKSGLKEEVRILLPEENAAYSAMAASDLCLMASGTATLESTLLGTPPLILYKISPVSFAIGKRLVTNRMIGLPNILMGKAKIPEILQKDCNPKFISKVALEKLAQDEKNSVQWKKIRSAVQNGVGKSGSVARAANYIAEKL